MAEWVPSADDLRVHGDAPGVVQLKIRAKDVVKRALATGTPVPQAARYRVVAVLGQSNAHGAGQSASDDVPDTDPRVHQWAGCGRRRDRILLATDPLLHGTPGAGVGFATTFGGLLAQQTGDAVLLVPAARGDTSFHPKNGFTWDPDDDATRVNLFDRSVRQIAGALRTAGPDSELSAVLWHQGESDVPLTSPTRYQNRLDTLITRLRGRFGTVPFIIGQMVPEEIANGHPGYPGIDAVHRSTPTRHDLCAFVAGPDGMHNPGESIHYNAAGARELGRRMFADYRDTVAVNR
ncbi:sialate O-acetylesterase [Gordonia sp. NPDC003504]